MFTAAVVVGNVLDRLGREPTPAPPELSPAPAFAKTVTLTRHIPEGLPGPEHFEIVQTRSPTGADLAEGDVLVHVLSMSADPYLRSGCKSEDKGGAVPRPMSGFVAGRVLASKRQGWEAGDYFGASLPFCTVQLIPAKAAGSTLMWKLTGMVTAETISLGVGVLGMPGSTAYGGLLDVLRPKTVAAGKGKAAKPAETIWVSGAAGAVGGLVGQIAKGVFGLTVVGSCGGPEKGALIKQKYGFDHAVDYKAVTGGVDGLVAAVKEVAPRGIDMYFDNVGGDHFEAAMKLLRPHGRVAVCGGIAHYNDAERVPEHFNPTDMIYSFQRVEGFMCMPWLSGKKGNFLKDMKRWIDEGKIAVQETHFDGVEAWPLAFQSLFTGKKTGKVVIDTA